MRLSDMFKIDDKRRMDSKKSFISANVLENLYRSATFVDRAVFAIDIIVVFVVFKI